MSRKSLKRDIEELGRYKTTGRAQKEDVFKSYFLERLMSGHIVYTEKAHIYTVYSTRHGRIDIYPVTNRCFLVRRSKWIKPGMEWLVKNILS
jgi:hypothetical protein